MINVANLSEDFPVWISDEEYDTLKIKKNGGWSNCETQMEWMVKLHYLRKGFKEQKIIREVFFKKEKELIIRWWSKWC
ncbi:MAG: hypothetical protein HN580_00795 [Deltaproteobacteria bacterium]|jgi:hypothetical protein|nr:hypothetical protein [Deltaproteobacteria bacterium]MBT4088173.1 hypothetical protein [Deltaproteobacteria bacterium]MBT4268072.1 hypothetical protein [Deltaproteobacteria bacterium]MBT4641460.1 hypothetical protein [Deltaproteobacteria bacterium]MBT6500075.1 hypothetical protein [Deltaproteobacteria bacterium]